MKGAKHFSTLHCRRRSPGDYAGFPGCGLLRLHSTYRHDLKIYASDEGRVQMTAAAFAKVCKAAPSCRLPSVAARVVEVVRQVEMDCTQLAASHLVP